MNSLLNNNKLGVIQIHIFMIQRQPLLSWPIHHMDHRKYFYLIENDIFSCFFQSYSSHMDLAGRRKNATRETTATLKAWLYEHRKNPYPTKSEKVYLAIMTKMTLTQVSTWFANARRRLKKENKMTWSPRNRYKQDCFLLHYFV